MRRKISPYRPRETTPSWMRAPAPSLMPMIGQPVFIARSMTLVIFSPYTSPSEPPKIGEVLAEHAHLAAVDGAVAGDHAVAVRAVASPARTPSSGAGRARRARRTSPRRRASRCARARSAGPWRAASRPPSPTPACTASSRRRSRSASFPAVVWMSMPESSGGRRCPRRAAAVVGSALVGSALTCTTLVVVNAHAIHALRSTSRPSRRPPGRSGACGCTRQPVHQRPGRRRRPERNLRGRGRPPDRGARAARAGVGDPARRRAHLLRRRRPGRGRRVVAVVPLVAGYAVARVVRGVPEVAQRRAPRTSRRCAASWWSGSRSGPMAATSRWRSSGSASTSTRPPTSCRCPRRPRWPCPGTPVDRTELFGRVLHEPA